MVVWGGDPQRNGALRRALDTIPSPNTWTATTIVGAPSRRYGHTAVWTGTRMLVWGGADLAVSRQRRSLRSGS